MTRNEYMKILTHRLRRLPKDDYSKAVEYFEEYFEEAGPDQEQQAIEDLGSPEEAAKALIVGLAAANVKEPPKTIKKGLSAVWIAILAVFAAPVAVPMALCVIIVAGILLLSLGAVIISVIAAAAGIGAAGIVSIAGGAALLFQSFADGVCCIGLGLFCTGIGIIFIYGAILFFRWCVKRLSVLLSKIMKGGNKK